MAFESPAAGPPDRRFVWEEGKSAQEIMIERERRRATEAAPAIANIAKAPAVLTFWKVTWAVFVGNLFFAIFATIVYEISQH